MLHRASDYGLDETVAFNILRSKYPSPARVALAAALCQEVLFEKKSWTPPTSLVNTEKMTALCGTDPARVRNAVAHWVAQSHLYQKNEKKLSYPVANLEEIYRWDPSLGAWIAVAVADLALSLVKNPSAGELDATGEDAVDLFAWCRDMIDRARQLIASGERGVSQPSEELEYAIGRINTCLSRYEEKMTRWVESIGMAAEERGELRYVMYDVEDPEEMGIRAYFVGKNTAGWEAWNNRLGANVIAVLCVLAGWIALAASGAGPSSIYPNLIEFNRRLSMAHQEMWWAVPFSSVDSAINSKIITNVMSAAVISYPVRYQGEKRRGAGKLSEGMLRAAMRGGSAGVGALLGAVVSGAVFRSMRDR